MNKAAAWLQRGVEALVPIDRDAASALLRYAAVLTATAGVVLGLGLPRATPAVKLAMVTMGLVLGLFCAWASRQRSPQRLGMGVVAAMSGCVAVLLSVAVISGLGLHSVSLGLVALVIAVTGALVGTAAALALTVVSLVGVLVVGLASQPGDSMVAQALEPWATQRLLTSVFIVMCGAWASVALGKVLRRSLAERGRRELMYRRLFSRSASALVLQRGWLIVEANEAAARLFGYESGDEMQGLDLSAFYPAGQVALMQTRLERLAADPEGAPLEATEFQLKARDGRTLFVNSSAATVMLDDGPAVEVLYLDVGELRQHERQLLRSEALLSRLFAANPDCISLADVPEGRFVMVNRAFENLTGYSSPEVAGRTALELGLWQQPEAYGQLLARLQEQGSADQVYATLVAKSGRLLRVRISAALFVVEGRTMRVTSWRDVTAIERTRQEYEAILQTAPIGIAYVRDGRFVQCNRRFEEMFGRPGFELSALSGRDLWADDAEYRRVNDSFGPLLDQGGAADDEFLMRRSDTTTFYCRIRAQPIDARHPAQGGAIWLFEDITERRLVAETLAQARDAAEAASRAKSAFLANLSHEIRTPLNALIGLIGLAQGEGAASGAAPAGTGPSSIAAPAGYLQLMLDSAESLSAIVSDTLDLSKIEAGRFTLELRPFSLHALLQGAQAGWQALARARGLAFELQPPPAGTDWLLGDALRIRQILGNYVANALKFTTTGTVRVAVERQAAGGLRFEVTDTGEGIAEEAQARLFQPFTQADDSTTRRYGGTGLGLSVCRELASLMGGQVGVRSRPGSGSCFWVELPLPDAEPPRAGLAGQAPGEPALAGLQVLVAEDNEVNMLITASLLERWGAVVGQATNGLDAVEQVRRAHAEGRPYDLVLMDVQMPEMDGHAAARLLRREFRAQELPIVALTASVLVAEREQGLAAGMDAFLAKPVNADQLRDTVQRLTRARAVAAG